MCYSTKVKLAACEVDTISSILQMSRNWGSEQRLVHNYTANNWQSKDYNPGLLTPSSGTFPVHHILKGNLLMVLFLKKSVMRRV